VTSAAAGSTARVEARDGRDDWDQHWSGYADSASDNPAQHFRHRIVRRLVARAGPTRILDIGCGQGDLLRMLADASPGAELFGVELSRTGVERSVAKVPAADVRQVDLLSPSAEVRMRDIGADVATCVEVLEHLDDPGRFLRNVRHALAPGATLIVTVPGGRRSKFDLMIGHRRHYAPMNLHDLLVHAGFDVQHVWGAGFPFFNLYRWVVIARGDRLAADVDASSRSRLAASVMAVFDVLLRCSRTRGRYGWQTVAVATWPASTRTPRSSVLTAR